MKKYISILALSVMLCGCGTDRGPGVYYKTTITNNSGVTVDFIPYQNSVKNLSRKVTLNNNNSIFKEVTSFPPDGGGFNMINVLFVFSGYNMVEIVFDNSKKTVYYDYGGVIPFNPLPNNIFDLKYYIEKNVNTYEVTTQDYIDATDCGGPCN